MTPGSLWMIHDPSIIVMGNERDLKDAIRLLEACKDSILNVYERRIKITREQAAALMTRTTWMDAQKALEDGFIDGILSVRQAGPTDCVVTQADAEKKVAAWLERHKVSASAITGRAHTGSAVLKEADAPPRAADETPEPIEQHENEPHEPTNTQPEETGTPVSQLQKRLALIMPTEAKYKEQ